MVKKKPAGRKLLLAVSFVSAVALWLIVSVFLNPESTRTISRIPINVDSYSATLDAMGLSVVGTGAETVKVEVSGNRLDLSSLTADDFTVTPRFSGVDKAGIYTLDLSVVVNSGDGNIEVVSVSPRTVSITVARIDVVTLPLTYKVTGDVPDGYFLEGVTLADEYVRISGPADVISGISSAAVIIEEAVNGSAVLPVRLFDAQGNEITDENLELSVSRTEVSVRVLKTKVLTLVAQLVGLPGGIPNNAVTLSVAPSTITVAGPEDVINTMDDVFTVASININTVSESEVRETELTLPGGVQTVDGTSSVLVEITVAEDMIVTYVDVTNFELSPYLQGFNVTVETVRLRNVEVVGKAEVVDAITSEDIVATVMYDMSDTPQKGRYTMTVELSSPTLDGFWVVGTYEVNVKVS